MPHPTRTVTKAYVRAASRKAGLRLSEERIAELAPLLQTILDGLEPVRALVEKHTVEPSPTFRVLEE